MMEIASAALEGTRSFRCRRYWILKVWRETPQVTMNQLALSFKKNSAYFLLKSRKLLHLSGDDCQSFLQGLTTNDIPKIKNTTNSIYTLFLSHKGRGICDANIIHQKKNEENAFWIEYDGNCDRLLQHLKRYRLRAKVKIQDVSEKVDIYSIMPRLEEEKVAQTKMVQINELQEDGLDAVAFNDTRGNDFGYRAIMPKTLSLNLPETFMELSEDKYHTQRMLLGSLEGLEYMDQIPLECNAELLNAICFSKGCYVGQELTARTQFKGNIRKRTVPIVLLKSNALNQELSALNFPTLKNLENELNKIGGLGGLDQYDCESSLKDQKIISVEDSKRCGSIVASLPGSNVAIAQMRLEKLFSEEPMTFMSEDGQLRAIPFQPTWWPEINPITGKQYV